MLTKTEGLTGVIGAENPVVRAVFEHVAPLVVETEFVQETSTARMSQIAINYRDSSLAETHCHHGHVAGGDRLSPKLLVTTRGRTVSVGELLDPSRFTLFLANVSDAEKTHNEVSPKLVAWQDLVKGHPINAPSGEAADEFTNALGSHPIFTLVRPDGYVSYVGPLSDIEKLLTYLNRWLTPDGDQHA